LEHHQWATLPLIVSGRFAFYLPQQAGFPLIGLPVTGPGPLLVSRVESYFTVS
jgi:hypothetical protein